MFRLDPAFEATSEALASLPFCEARLHADRRFCWLILIPRTAGAVEIEDLGGAERGGLVEEIVLAGRAVRAMGQALGRPVDKLNIGQLGNVTRQLHVHVVGRRIGDVCWPGPVWGHGTAEAYGASELAAAKAAALGVF